MRQLQDLSERELLILTAEIVGQLEEKSTSYAEKFVELDLRIAEIELRYKMWAGIFGFASGIFASILTALIINYLA